MNGLSFLFAYALTLGLETCTLYLILRKQHGAKSIIINSILANSITLPFVWFVFPYFLHDYWLAIGLSEIFALLAEAAYYRKAFAKLGWKDALFASFACNSISFCIGLLLI